MKLPNGELAIIDRRKLEEYCLNPHQPRGRNKARVFASIAVGQTNAEVLREALLAAARNAEAQLGAAPMASATSLILTGASSPNGSSPEHLDGAARRRLAAADELLCTIGEKKAVMADIEMHSVVALLEDLPDEGLVRGQVGTVVETWTPGVYEVEFCDDNGRAYAMVALKAEQLMRLHHEPSHQAA